MIYRVNRQKKLSNDAENNTAVASADSKNEISRYLLQNRKFCYRTCVNFGNFATD